LYIWQSHTDTLHHILPLSHTHTHSQRQSGLDLTTLAWNHEGDVLVVAGSEKRQEHKRADSEHPHGAVERLDFYSPVGTLLQVRD
jgi:hypothetical protein